MTKTIWIEYPTNINNLPTKVIFKKAKASDEFFNLLSEFKAKYLIISFNSDGFISMNEFLTNLARIGEVNKVEI